MDIDLSTLRMIERDKDIPLDYLLTTLEDALLNAYDKTEAPVNGAKVQLDRKTGNVAVMLPEKDEEGGSFLDNINPESLVVLKGCRAEPSLANAAPEERFQFEREGYFCADMKDSKPGAPVFNRTVTLRDSWGQ